MPELPVVLGSEIAGELEDGTRVMAMTSGAGGYAELAAVERARIVPLPDGPSFAEGAAFLLTFLTAYIPLTRQVRLRPGGTVLVHAAAGGVGSAAIQVARSLGARVVAAVGSAEKLELCRELGAEEAYVYDDAPGGAARRRRRRPGRRRPVRRSARRASVRSARLVAIGYAAGLWPEVSPANLVGRNVGVHGFYLGRLVRHEPRARRARRSASCSRSGSSARCVRSSARSCRSPRSSRRTSSSSRGAASGKVVLVP